MLGFDSHTRTGHARIPDKPERAKILGLAFKVAHSHAAGTDIDRKSQIRECKAVRSEYRGIDK